MSYKGGQYWSETVMETTGEPRRLALSTDRTTIAADDSELAFITLRVQDKQGRTVPRSCPEIHFSIEGAGEIVSTDNGNPIDFTPFSSHNRQAFNGLALVIVKAKKGETGSIVVKAESAGLRSAKVTIETK